MREALCKCLRFLSYIFHTQICNIYAKKKNKKKERYYVLRLRIKFHIYNHIRYDWSSMGNILQGYDIESLPPLQGSRYYLKIQNGLHFKDPLSQYKLQHTV